ncbi:hypothetical protein ABZW30_23400 [Kitasatospora sp. NPDC004669]|uniref:hypothetical protein n=1 Tax=Kitasatospora sp. NPDC004669 TaxID=3154555 RepID=UPI0033BF2F08
MRMKLRPGLHYAPVHKGVFIGTEKAKFVLGGPPVLFRLVDLCVPRLEEGCTEEDLLAAVGDSENGRKAVRHVLSVLREHGLLLDLDAVGEPDRADQERFADALCQLEAESADPYAAFARLRRARVLLQGPARVVLPAARTLARSGIGEVVLVVAAEETAALAATVERYPAVTVTVAGGPEELPEADAAVVCVAATDLATAPAGPSAPLVVPVLLGTPVAVVGPPAEWSADFDRATRLRERAVRWADGEQPYPRATGDALAVGLAAQLVFRMLGGIVRADNSYVVHGPTLEVAALGLGALPEPRPGVLALDALSDGAVEDASRTAEEWHGLVKAAAEPWTGLLRLSAPVDLPQLPLSLAAVEDMDVEAGLPLVRWAADQATAGVEAGLTGLRAMANRCPSLPADQAPATGPRTVGAAGLTADRWLVDGALRILAPTARKVAELPYQEVGTDEGRRLWRALEDFELVPVRMDLLAVAGVDWLLARVTRRDTGELLSVGWGRDGHHAALAALANAMARTQVLRVRGKDLVGHQVETAAINDVEPAELAILCEQLREHFGVLGLRLVGTSHPADPLLGSLEPWWGPVTLEAVR